MIKNFLITGHGRSGTSFLSNLMNKSTQWTVLHEPNNSSNVEEIQNRFSKEYYGEVNSYLRWYASKIKVDRKGVLIRNPLEILISTFNHKGECNKVYIYRISESLYLIDELVKNDSQIIYFKSLINNPIYCQQIIKDFGINDVDVKEEDIKLKKNMTINARFNYENCSNFIEIAKREFGWFIELYNL